MESLSQQIVLVVKKVQGKNECKKVRSVTTARQFTLYSDTTKHSVSLSLGVLTRQACELWAWRTQSWEIWGCKWGFNYCMIIVYWSMTLFSFLIIGYSSPPIKYIKAFKISGFSSVQTFLGYLLEDPLSSALPENVHSWILSFTLMIVSLLSLSFLFFPNCLPLGRITYQLNRHKHYFCLEKLKLLSFHAW